MWNTIGAILQLIFLVLKNKLEKDEEKKKEKNALSIEASDAIKRGDVSRTNYLLSRMRK